MGIPKRRIFSQETLDTFLHSREFANFWVFLQHLNDASRNRTCASVVPPTEGPMKELLQLLQTLMTWVEEIAPLEQPGRFGNKAFRTFHNRLVEKGEMLLATVSEKHSAELAQYLQVSFGSEVRLDFGTGHELAFLILIYCLDRAGVVTPRDFSVITLLVFPKYLKVTRALQTKYQLEPAGSRGVWGLDDFAFLCFIFGSAQLLESHRIDPDFMLNDRIIEENRENYLYVDAIGYIKEYKKGPFHEHSPTLWDISGARGGWKKINQGMLKMYKAEVLNKVPVMQHVLFGDLFRYPESESGKEENKEEVETSASKNPNKESIETSAPKIAIGVKTDDVVMIESD